MHESVPQELVDMIIDDVGGGSGRVYRPPLKGDRVPKSDIIFYETIKSCALVARSWTYRSHMNLFREIVFNVAENEGIQDLTLPPKTSLQFVKFLEIYVAPANVHRGAIIVHLLSLFSVSPLEFLQIDGGLFTLKDRLALRDCFSALSGLLLDITFRFCLFNPEPLRDILAIRDTKANIMFLGCDQDHPDDPDREDIDWEPVYHDADRTLCVMGGEGKPSEEFFADLSELSVNFRRLEVDFYEDGSLVGATQTLIEASGGALSFLKLNVISDMSMDLPEDAMALPPPSLASCVDLSELVLNMKGSYSCVFETSDAILLTLLEAESPNLFKITLEVEEVKPLFLAENRGKYSESWKELDSTLTMLADKLMSARGVKLIFVMEVTCRDDTIRRAKKWVPRFLSRFSDAGFLHVHDGEDDICYGYDYNEEDERACMGRAVLKEYEYESESDEDAETAGAAAENGGNKENQEGDAGGREGGEKDGELDGGNEGDDEGEENA